MISIQVHGVVSCAWVKGDSELHPRILVIETVHGRQEIALFPVRPEKKEGEALVA